MNYDSEKRQEVVDERGISTIQLIKFGLLDTGQRWVKNIVKKLTIGNRKLRVILTKILTRKRNMIRTENDIYC